MIPNHYCLIQFAEAVMSKTELHATEKQIEKAVSDWFRHAADRIKRQKK